MLSLPIKSKLGFGLLKFAFIHLILYRNKLQTLVKNLDTPTIKLSKNVYIQYKHTNQYKLDQNVRQKLFTR